MPRTASISSSHSDSEINKSEKQCKLHVDMKSKKYKQHAAYTTIKNHLKKLRDLRLFCAASKNNIDGVRINLALGASPNYADDYGRSPLHIAASKGYTDIVKYLLNNGADPNKCDSLQNTPLHLAACTHNLSIISLLLNAGADVKKLDIYGKNPLQLAKSKLQLLQRSWREGSIEMIQVRAELQLIVDILISVFSKDKDVSVDDLELMKLNLNSEEPNVEDQMSKLLTGLEQFKIS